ncbi:MAG: twin-arginine translocase subunit TatC [Bdellovibrionaceae bacterium]|nr:twin-arginine translocase subunit TatC [Pseudobdellovibrionaceae bacterium]
MSDLGQKESRAEGHMSLFEHLHELRIRLTKAAYGIFLGMLVCWYYSDALFNFLREPIQAYLPTGGLVFTAPMDKFMAHVKIAFVGGMLLSAPFWLFQLWSFIAPALYKKEKKVAAGFVAFGTVQFVMGLAFSYFVVLPMAFKFLMNFGGTTDKPMITIDNYLGFLTHTAVVFGLCFQMPVIISFLGLLGLVSQKFLREKRRYAVMVIAIVAAIAAPPDALSMVLLLVPMWCLYELSIFIVGYLERRRKGLENN